MSKKNPDFLFKVKMSLRKLPLWVKISSLFMFANILFPFFIGDDELRIYFYTLVVLVIFIAFWGRLIIGKGEFKVILTLWLTGSAIYLCFAIPYIYSQYDISPHLKLDNLIDRWLYTLALTIRLLGLFSIGLIFVSIISPIQFLRWGKWGYAFALLLRVIEQAVQKLHETRMALLMQNKWPEEHTGIIRLNQAYLIVKNSPKLIITTIRNMIVWFPWAWLCFNRIKINIKGGDQ